MVWGGVKYVCTPVPVGGPTLNFVSYSQNDLRWANQVYAGGVTFALAGCLVVGLADVLSLVYPDGYEPPLVAEKLRAAGCFNDALLSNPARVPLAFPKLSWNGVRHYRTNAADLNLIAKEIAANGAVIAEVAFDPRYKVHWVDSARKEHWNQHFVVLRQLVGDDCQFADPWTGETGLLTESRYFRAGWEKTAARVITGLRLFGTVE
jgi:hypothetical protein